MTTSVENHCVSAPCSISKHTKCQQRFEGRRKKHKKPEFEMTCQPLICARDIYNSNVTSRVTCSLVRDCHKRFPHQRVSALCYADVPSATELPDWRTNLHRFCHKEEFSKETNFSAARQISRKKYCRDRKLTIISFLLLLFLCVSKAASEKCTGLLLNVKKIYKIEAKVSLIK